MSLIHDTIKINLSRLGYLPNYPYHMISDSEMCDGFLSSDNTGYFFDYYPLLDNSLQLEYDALISAIRYYIYELKNPNSDDYTMPEWVYSYMLGSTISIKSDEYDISYLADMLNVKIDFGVFSADMQRVCLDVSTKWLKKLSDADKLHRPPTIFGEPHVIKSLRLANADIN